MDIQKQHEDFCKIFKPEFGTIFNIDSVQFEPLEDRYYQNAQRLNWAFAGWLQAAKAQAVPEGKYILQTFSTYSGVCEDTFNHKNIGVFESIDAAMFHARNIGLVMDHYGYEFRVIESQEPK